MQSDPIDNNYYYSIKVRLCCAVTAILRPYTERAVISLAIVFLPALRCI